MAPLRRRTPRLRAPKPLALATAALLAVGWLSGTASAADSRADGQIRLAHLSPDAPAVDVYLYAKGAKSPRLVLRHVGYGVLSPYQRLGVGGYEVAMRPADAPASSKPLLSTSVTVRGGNAYTVAGMGPFKGIKLQVINDGTSAPSGRAELRVIAASLKEPSLDVTAGGQTLQEDLRFASVTPYRRLPAKRTEVSVKGGNGTARTTVRLKDGTVNTVVVLDGDSGLKLVALRDASAPVAPPSGGVDTGFGGLAAGQPATVVRNEGGPSWTLPGLLVLAAGATGLLGGLVLWRRRGEDTA